jgi:site-specific DNA-methyltransferase (adenine-specific)
METAILQIPVSTPFSIQKGTSPDSLRALPPNSIDHIITDPPYGLTDKEIDIRKVIQAFLNGDDFRPNGGGYNNNEWDAFVPGPKMWTEAYRILKPGGYLIAFSGKRTIHYLSLAVQMSGFEIKDQLLWFHGQGNPKTPRLSGTLQEAGASERILNLFGNYRGDLRPLYEPILIAQKPISAPNIARNLIKHGVGGINSAEIIPGSYAGDIISSLEVKEIFNGKESGIKTIPPILSFSKASQREKKDGLNNLIIPGATDVRPESTSFANQTPINGFNFHPTVKPIELMKYLIELFSIEGSIILDPFMGSGTTGVAALKANRQFVGTEMDEKYFIIAKHRIEMTSREISNNPISTANNIKKLFQDNPNIKLMGELELKINNSTATINEFRKFDELLKKFGPVSKAA